VRLLPEKTVTDVSFGGFQTAMSPEGKIIISPNSRFNDFGKKMGYQFNDELLSLQGTRLTVDNIGNVVADVKNSIKAGENLQVKVARKNGVVIDTVLLSQPIEIKTTVQNNVLELIEDPTEEQVKVRNAWLSTPDKPLPGVARAEDVKDINSIINAMYTVISGKAGPRNWDRFRSLFYPGATMSALNVAANGQAKYRSSTFEDYIALNSPFMNKSDFFEEELGRKVQQFGNIAQVQTAYQYRLSQNGRVEQRGVNQVSLVKSQGRWWITAIAWQDEASGLSIPADLLNK